MRTVKNLTKLPIRVPLPRRKVLHLGPGRSGEVKDAALELAAFQKMVEDGKIEVVVSGSRGGAAGGSAAATPGRQAAQGGGGKVGHRKSGDR